MILAGHVARIGEGRGVYSDSVVKPEGKSPLGRSMFRWEDNFKMELQKVRCEVVDWFRIETGGLVNAVMNLGVP
jgi:hypothetical protein